MANLTPMVSIVSNAFDVSITLVGNNSSPICKWVFRIINKPVNPV